jgi:hypothetical protein
MYFPSYTHPWYIPLIHLPLLILPLFILNIPLTYTEYDPEYFNHARVLGILWFVFLCVSLSFTCLLCFHYNGITLDTSW